MAEELELGMTYILDDQDRLVRCEDTEEWMLRFLAKQVVRHTYIPHIHADALVSTCFLGTATGAGNIFETKVFDVPGYRGLQWRYRTKADALEGHEQVLTILRNDPNLSTQG